MNVVSDHNKKLTTFDKLRTLQELLKNEYSLRSLSK